MADQPPRRNPQAKTWTRQWFAIAAIVVVLGALTWLFGIAVLGIALLVTFTVTFLVFGIKYLVSHSRSKLEKNEREPLEAAEKALQEGTTEWDERAMAQIRPAQRAAEGTPPVKAAQPQTLLQLNATLAARMLSILRERPGIILALCIAVASDALDIFFPVVQDPLLGNLLVDGGTTVLLALLLHSPVSSTLSIIAGLIELFPGIETFPFYTVAVLVVLVRELLGGKSVSTGQKPPRTYGRYELAWWEITFFIGISALALFAAYGWLGLAGALIAVLVIVVLLWRFITKSLAWTGYRQRTTNRYYLEPRRSPWGKIFFLIFVAAILFFALPNPLKDSGKKFFLGLSKNPNSPMAKWSRSTVRATNYLLGIPKRMTEQANRFFERQIAYATGDYYTGQVDANAKKKLGVYLEDIEPSSQEFEDTEAVTVWGTLTALTLDPDKRINVRLLCALGDDTGKYGMMDPEFLPGLTNLDRQDLTCTFPPGKIPEGADTVTLTATFNFETQAYLKAYFMDKQRMQTLRRGGKDPLTFYDVSDTHPTAIYTNGPVMIGMEMLEPLVGLPETQETKFRLGVTVENMWDGKIKAISNLTLKIPDSMSLVDCEINKGFRSVACNREMPECEPSADGSTTYQRVWKLLPSAVAKLNDIEKFESFSCRIKIDPTARLAVLGNVPLATHYIKAMVTYDYELHAATPITVKPSEGFNVYIAPAEAPLRQADGTPTKVTCTGKHSDADIITAEYKFFRIPQHSRNPDISDPNTDAEELASGSTSCGETCTVPFIIPQGKLRVGDTLLCRIHQPKLDTQSSASQLIKSCMKQCANEEDGAEYNACMDECKGKAVQEEFSATATVPIINSKPVLQYRLALPAPKQLQIAITITDPDLQDKKIGVGYRFTGIDRIPWRNPNIPCADTPAGNPIERRCETTLEISLDELIAGDTVTVELTPDDGHTTGRAKTASYTYPGPACDPSIEVCPTEPLEE